MDIYFKRGFPIRTRICLNFLKDVGHPPIPRMKGLQCHVRENLMPRQFLKQKKGRRTQHLAEHFFPFILTIGRGVQVLIHHYDM